MNNQNRRHLLTSRSITDQAAELKCLKNSRRTSSRPRVNGRHDGCARSINRPKRIVSPWRPEFVAEQLALDCAKEYAPCASPLSIFSPIYPEIAGKSSRKCKVPDHNQFCRMIESFAASDRFQTIYRARMAGYIDAGRHVRW